MGFRRRGEMPVAHYASALNKRRVMTNKRKYLAACCARLLWLGPSGAAAVSPPP